MLQFLRDPFHEPRLDWREINTGFEDYQRYLKSIETRIPPSTYAFATAPWHYDTRYHECLHDSWLEDLVLSEVHPENDFKKRRVAINVKLLGAYHDGYIYLEYEDVIRYELASAPQEAISLGGSTTHGDWLTDEVRLSPRGYAEHARLCLIAIAAG